MAKYSLSPLDIKLVERALNLGGPVSRSTSPGPSNRSRTPSPPRASPRSREFSRNSSLRSPRRGNGSQEDARRKRSLTQVFREFDLDGSDSVDEEELLQLGRARRTLGQKSTEWTPEKNSRMMRAMGSGGSTVNSAQFVSYFLKSFSESSPDDFDTVARQFMEVARACRAKKESLQKAQPAPVERRRPASPPMVRRDPSPPASTAPKAEQSIAHLGSAAVLLDGSRRVKAVNQALGSLGVAGVLGKEFVEFCVAGRHKGAAMQAIQRAQQGQAAHCEFSFANSPHSRLSLVAHPSSIQDSSPEGRGWRQAELQRCFEAFDADSSGAVDVSELLLLGRMRRTLGQKPGEWTNEKNDRFIRALDPEGRNLIQAPRFVEYFNAKLPQDQQEFLRATRQFLQVAAAVQVMRHSGSMCLSQSELEAAVEQYCAEHPRAASPPTARRGACNVVLIFTPVLVNSAAEDNLLAQVADLQAQLRRAQANDELRALREEMANQEMKMMKETLELQSQLATALEEIRRLREALDEAAHLQPSSLDVAVLLVQDDSSLAMVDSNSTAKLKLGELPPGRPLPDLLTRSCHQELLSAVSAVRKGEQSAAAELKLDERNPAVGFTVLKRGDQLLMLSLDASWMLKPGTFVWELENKMVGGGSWKPAPLMYPAPPLPIYHPHAPFYHPPARRGFS